MFDFPASPSIDQVYTSGGVSYRYNGYGWVITGSSTGSGSISAGDTPPIATDNTLWFETDSGMLWLRYNDGNSSQWVSVGGPSSPPPGYFLPLTGGTLTGNLGIKLASGDANIVVEKATSGVQSILYGANAGKFRWAVSLGDGSAESTGNVGSNFGVARFNDAGAYVDFPLIINRATGQTTLSGWLFIQTTNDAQFDLRKASATNYNIIWGKTGTVARWAITMGDNVAESGSNAGSNFNITSWNDAGSLLGTPLAINRATGNTTLNNLIISGTYLTLFGATPAGINSTSNGPFIYGDQNSVAFHLGTGTGNYIFQNNAGGNIAVINTVGAMYLYGPGQGNYTNYDPTSGAKGGALILCDTNGGAYYGGTIEFWSLGGTYKFAAIRGLVVDGSNNSAGSIAFFTRVVTTDATLTKKGEVNSGGVWYNTNASWSAISDRSMKQNITPYTNGLEAIKSLQPVNFKYTKDAPFADSRDTIHIGLVAQEVKELLPEIVGEIDLNPMTDNPKMVATTAPGLLIYALINAVKELSSRLEAVENRGV